MSTATHPSSSNGAGIAVKPPSKLSTLKGWLEGDDFKNAIAKALPKHMTAERFVRIAITAAMRVPKLMECTQASVFNCLLALSQFGLEPDGRRAHLIPFEVSKKRGDDWVKELECTLIIDYKGYAELVMRSGLVSNIHADVVCENDQFEYNMGRITKHIIDFKQPRGPAYAAYAVVNLKDGEAKCEVISKEDIYSIRNRTQAWQAFSRPGSRVKQCPWNPAEPVIEYEMWKKGLALDTPIPTPDGWTTMGSISVGDRVFDMRGDVTRVIGVSEVKHIDCFRVIFADGESIVCDDEHRWPARIDGIGRPDWPIYTINELYAAKAAGLRVSMPVAGSLQLDDRDLPIDPWLLGYWLGDGNSDSARVTCGDGEDLDHFTSSVGATSHIIGKLRRDSRSSGVSVGVKHGFKVALRASKLLSNKHIPAEYLRASHSQRLRLLQGLVDSDGCVERSRGRAIFEQTNKKLAEQVCELVASLGEKYICKEYVRNGFGTTAVTYRVSWQPINCPASNPRKVARFRPRRIAMYRGVASIVRTLTVPTRCIAVDSPTHTYLAGRSMVPTHNTAFRRLTKWLTLSPEIRDLECVEDEQEDRFKDAIHTEGVIVSDSASKSDMIADMLDRKAITDSMDQSEYGDDEMSGDELREQLEAAKAATEERHQEAVPVAKQSSKKPAADKAKASMFNILSADLKKSKDADELQRLMEDISEAITNGTVSQDEGEALIQHYNSRMEIMNPK